MLHQAQRAKKKKKPNRRGLDVLLRWASPRVFQELGSGFWDPLTVAHTIIETKSTAVRLSEDDWASPTFELNFKIHK